MSSTLKQGMFSSKVETKVFNDHVRNFLRGSNIDAELGLKKFAFDLLARIIKKTPV